MSEERQQSESASSPREESSEIRLPADGQDPEGFDLRDPKLVRILVGLMKFQGSLQYPPAEILEGWERLYPGITRKLVEQSERQTRHRHGLETMRTNRSEDRADRGQKIMACLAGLGLVLSAAVGIFGSWIAACVLAIVSIGGPAAATAIAYGWGRQRLPPPSS